MFMGDFKDTEVGQILSMDLMLAFIVVTIFLGVSADALDLVSSQMDEASYIQALERITTENANILLNTPGSPENWEMASSPFPWSNQD
jgi:hypothetical protein